MAKRRKKGKKNLVGKKTTVKLTVALRKGGGQLMKKTDWNAAVMNLVITVLGGYILGVLSPSGSGCDMQPLPQPKPIYAQHQVPVTAGEQI